MVDPVGPAQEALAPVWIERTIVLKHGFDGGWEFEGLIARQPSAPIESRLIDQRERQPARDETPTDTLAAGERELQARLQKLLAGSPSHAPNKRLLAHLSNEHEHLFTLLQTPGVQATNWRAEQAIRPAVVNRKNWGGNRTWHGAETQQVLMSVIRTARQQHTDPVRLLTDLQRHPHATVSPALTIPVPTAKDSSDSNPLTPAHGP